MAIPSFPLGAVARLWITITTASGSTVVVDPGSLSFGLKEPDGTTYTYTWGGSTHVVTSTVGGRWGYVDWACAKEGIHRFGYVGTSANAGADEGAFSVFQRGY